MKAGRYFLTLGLLGLVAVLCGCATHADRIATARSAYFRGDLPASEAALSELQENDGPDTNVVRLDQALVDLAAGRTADAEGALRVVRDEFDFLEQDDAAEAAVSLVTDDTRRAYAGEDYEKILIRAFLALSNLMHDGGDAGAYALQVNEKQQAILQQFATGDNQENAAQPPPFKQVALGPYIRAMLAEETHTNHDDVVRSREQVVAWQPDFRDGASDVQRAKYDRHSQPGNGVLYVFTLVGRGPIKEQTYEVPTQAALLIADRIVSAVADQSLPPTVAPVPVPTIVRPYNRIDQVAVQVDGENVGTTATIVDVGELAQQQHEATLSEVIGWAVARRALKKGAIYAVKDQLAADESPLLDFALNALGVVWEATEAADTRCWGLLPDKIQVLRIELPVGEHEIVLSSADHHGPFGKPAGTKIRIEDGRNTYLLGTFPDDRLVGELSVSSRGLP